MIVKALEIRDKGTCIPMWAIRPTADNEAQRAILRHAGYGEGNYVILLGAHDCVGHYNPDTQHGHTRRMAHVWIKEHFDELKDGDVVDVEFILGKRPSPKLSEIQKNYCDSEWERMKSNAGF